MKVNKTNIYVMSDIHGCYDEFMDMLKLIKFKPKDELYITGDCIDRGPEPLLILDYIQSHENIKLIKGNHEEMYLDYYESNNNKLWNYNGGKITLNAIQERGEDYKLYLYNYLKNLPLYYVIDKYILVHAGLYFPTNYKELTLEELLFQQDDETNLWSRENTDKEITFKDYKIICGHTPVQTITYDYENVKILHKAGHIYIDTGCVFGHIGGKLSCLRLNDLKEYYI